MNDDNGQSFGVQPFSGGNSTALHDQEGYLQFKGYLHQRLIDRVEEIGADFASLRREAVLRFVTLELDRLHSERPFPLREKETETQIGELTDELTRFGPLEAAMQ
ncbi:MAG: CpaF family protein, partial [Acidithiobacillus sp.]